VGTAIVVAIAVKGGISIIRSTNLASINVAICNGMLARRSFVKYCVYASYRVFGESMNRQKKRNTKNAPKTGRIRRRHMIPALEQAQTILEKYNKDKFHLYHAKVVSETLRYFAKKVDPEHEEYWAVVGLLHDIDFELFPDEHCIKGVELLRNENVDDRVIQATMSHGWGIAPTPYEPTHSMEKILFATDELTGLIGAAALMRPSKSVSDMELSSVKKKFKDKKFAAGCDQRSGDARLDARSTAHRNA
jgi:putative nucleotidyltransferase with HDIG domain